MSSKADNYIMLYSYVNCGRPQRVHKTVTPFVTVCTNK